MRISPDTAITSPGARLVFSLYDENDVKIPLSTLGQEVLVYFPGEGGVNGTIHETNDTFSWIVPPAPGSHTVEILLKGDPESWAAFELTINPSQARELTVTAPAGTTPPVHIDFYDPVGQLVYSEDVSLDMQATVRPALDWLNGEYTIYIRDTTGLIDVVSDWIERPVLASMETFYSLPHWQRQIIEYLKYEMMGDTDPMHPGALFTLEEYSRHWASTVSEINSIPPETDFPPRGIPSFWANTMLKGTTLRVYHALANRAVTIPRWSGVPVMIQDESHYQQSWERRYQLLREEYEPERAFMKAAHLPGPAVTVDPWLGWGGGNLAGTSGLAMIGRPSWFMRGFAGR